MAPNITNTQLFSQDKPPFDMQAQELPGLLSVKMTLSKAGVQSISSITNQLEKSLESCRCELQGINVEFSGYPFKVGFGAKQVLNTVRMYDPKAIIC